MGRFVLVFAMVFLVGSAEARGRHRISTTPSCQDFLCLFDPPQAAFVHQRHSTHQRLRHARHLPSYGGQIVSHPSGCPRSAFCGCGAAVRLFGRPLRNLWLAANWFKFPRTDPAPGMAAVRRHHVMVLEADLGGGVWTVYDANSGGRLTRVHARSIAGYTVVNPHGGA